MPALIVIPTYNEIDNLPCLIDRLNKVRQRTEIDVIFVDDNSPDGTGSLIDKLSYELPWISVMHRAGKLGLGTAYVAGFKWGLEHGYDLLLEMDADLSHDPGMIPTLIHKSAEADLVLGSRYIDGGSVDNWGLGRKIISKGGSLYARTLLGLPIKDLTGGFKCFRREVLEALDLDSVESNGYCFQVEMTYRAYKLGFKVAEVPITFHDREAGRSKMSRKIFMEALLRVPQLRHLDVGEASASRSGFREAEASPTARQSGEKITFDQVLDVRPAPAMFMRQTSELQPGHLAASIGVMAYNEEATVGKVLDALLQQETDKVQISEIIVVASGCTDGTHEVVEQRCALDNRVRLLVQEKREGKASAINLFLRNSAEEMALVIGGDTIPSPNLVEKLISPMLDSTIGMTGGRPIPLNDSRNFFGYAAHMLWNLHHRLALDTPKCGEAIAFRKLFTIIPGDTAVDELSIESLITGMGLKLKYIGDAVLYNRGPDNIRDFMNQRRRIYAGHLRVKADQKYQASTMDGRRILRLWLSELGHTPKDIVWGVGVAGLEAYSRLLGYYDFRKKKSHHVWTVVGSTKQVTRGIKDGRALESKDSVVSVYLHDYASLEVRWGRKEAQRRLEKLASFLSRDLREGRLVKIIPSKGLIILTADAEHQEVAETLLRAREEMNLSGNAVAKDVPAIGADNLSYGLFSLNGQSTPAMPAYSLDPPAAARGSDVSSSVEM